MKRKIPVLDIQGVLSLLASSIISHIMYHTAYYAGLAYQSSVRVPGCQKLTNDCLTRYGTGCFIGVPI